MYSRFYFGPGSIAGVVFRLRACLLFLSKQLCSVGYGDVVLPAMGRTLGPVESIIGVLMCGLSASFLFAIVSRIVKRETLDTGRFAQPHTEFISTPKDSNHGQSGGGGKQK
jgi:hypothetical protein